MRIAFDAKRYFHNKTGLGNYSRKVVAALSAYYPKHEYFLCDKKAEHSQMKVLPNCEILQPENKSLPDAVWRSYSIITDLKRKEINLYHGLSNEIPLSFPDEKIKSVVTIHDVIYKLYPHYYPLIDRLIYERKVAFACKHADLIMATSQQTKSDLSIYYNVDPQKIKVVYQSVVMPDVSEEQHQINCKKFNLYSPYFLFVGRIEERKNLLSALKAFKQLDEKNIQFFVVGDGGAYKETCQKYAHEELYGRVKFFSDVSNQELCTFYKQSVALVFASHYEGFGIPILEAQMMRTPVITSQYGCFKEIGSVAAIYVDPTDINQLSDAMCNVYTDTALRMELQQAGLENAKRFTPELFAKDLMAAYQSQILN
jgi:glycosyltransferase involved in cell wall biosynthesis